MQSQLAYKLVVFDWDGTLMDSLSRIAQCMQVAAEDIGIVPAKTEQIHNIVGLALDIAIRRLHPQLTEPQVELMRLRYSHHYVEREANPSPFYDGVTQMLTQLHGHGALLSVATGKSRKGLDRVFASHNVGGLFHSSRCADETRSKPEPDMLLEIIDYHGVKPEQAVMIGDTEFDLEMASRARVPSIGVGWGAHSVSRLQKHSPKVCVTTVAELESQLYV